MLGALRMPAVITLADAVHWMLLAAAFATALGVIAYLSARYHVAVMRLSEKTAALHDEQVRLEAVAESRRGIRPARKAGRPAKQAARIAWAIRSGAAAWGGACPGPACRLIWTF
jgi:uncharacterized membrane protein